MNEEQRPFWNAARDGDVSTVKINPNFKNHAENGDSPLHIAVYNHHSEIVSLLLSKDADPNFTNERSLTPLHIACASDVEIVKLLIQYQADVHRIDEIGTTTLMVAAKHCNTEVAKLLIAKNVDISSVNKFGQTAFIVAATNNAKDIIKMLLTMKTDVNHIDVRKRTALYIAASNGHKNIVELLLDAKANINLYNTDYRTPLCGAAFFGHIDVVKVLLSHNPDINLCDKDGASPVYLAAQNGHSGVVSELISNNANIYQADKQGITPLQIAKRQLSATSPQDEETHEAYSEIVNTIEKQLADNISLAVTAIENDDIVTWNTLLMDGMDPNSTDSKDDPLLLKAIACGNKSAIARLSRMPGIDIYKLNRENISPFIFAMKQTNRAIVDIISYPIGSGVVLDIPTEQLNVDRTTLLGSGSYAVVFKGKYNNEVVAVKEPLNQSKANDLKKEIAIMQGLSSPFFVNLLATSGRNTESPKLVLEYMDSKTLRHYLDEKLNGKQTTLEFNKVEIAWFIANGLAQIHRLGHLHRDLKSENILLSTTKYMKLADFGLMRQICNSMTSTQGSLPWMAPEVFETHGHYGYAADIYSFGVILTELDTYQVPYKGLKQGSIMDGVRSGTLRPKVSNTCEDWYKDLIDKCLQSNPKNRPSTLEILDILEPHLNGKNDEPIEATFNCQVCSAPNAYSVEICPSCNTPTQTKEEKDNILAKREEFFKKNAK
ncbi:serine/threonine-protein phosphatase 6 regulatory ankyrin repeat subunit A-like [Thraustotheca clavata]|uniref:Serine/threonine-protein phosphatase 6 regulatory ankyrin repeat subunit A-like n=1 Tax=Thraustotheca clavata TaxID=74557 RepID=A0A1V9Z0S4_9STRA|nr:serine/threonine-protein phosphatase 6 regulatory ankyrin repeat subunit A-like [Thraustotheca clavata]